MKGKRNFAFVAELFLLFFILLFVIVVIVQVVAKTRNESLYAKHLTEAVCMATDTAEILQASGDAKDRYQRLSGMAGVTEAREEKDGVVLRMDGDHDDAGFQIHIRTQRDPSADDRFLNGQIDVYYGAEQEPIYRLETGVYEKGKKDGA